MDRNKMKRKIAMMLCVCVLFASSAPLALAEAEATPSEPQAATLEENQPKQPVSREKIGMKLTPNNGVVSVALTGKRELCCPRAVCEYAKQRVGSAGNCADGEGAR